MAFSRFGNVRFGHPLEKPEFSTFSWISMVFTTGIDASIMIMSLFEPIHYLEAPPFGIEPFSEQAYDYAHMYGQFHWGPSAWIMYVPATIVIAYVLFIKKGDTTRISVCVDEAFKSDRVRRILKPLVDFFVAFGIIGGIGASIGLEIPVISEITCSFLGIPNSLLMQLAMLGILLVLFGVTVLRGLDKGIQRLSTLNVYLVLAFIIFVFLVGPTRYLVDAETNSIGLLFSNFVRMSTYTDPHLRSGFPQRWTTFYWGWWLAYMPVLGLFVARISRGRTVRQVILGQVLWGSMGCMTFFAILGGYSLHLQKSGILDVAGLLNSAGQEAAISAIIQTLPMSRFMLLIYSICCFVFLATTVSSTAYTLSSMTSKHLTGYDQPTTLNRLVWALVFIAFSAGIIIVGGFATVQVVCVIAGFPLIFIVFVLMRAIRNLQKEAAREAVIPPPEGS
ncbi:MAG: BCCT family transporter [Bacillota bacterium]|nr:BCCT family transporter [Bacillota bacterium]